MLSTFPDFKAERNILPERAFPVLQEVCEAQGLDFQVVDMRWGVTAEMMNDHQVSALCLQEINTCRQVSCGPNFVVSEEREREREIDRERESCAPRSSRPL